MELLHDYHFRQLNKEEAVSAFENRLEQNLYQPEHVTLDDKPLNAKLIECDKKCGKKTNKPNKPSLRRTLLLSHLKKIFINPEDRTNFFDNRNKT